MRFVDRSSIKTDGGGVVFEIPVDQRDALVSYLKTNGCFLSGSGYGYHKRQVRGPGPERRYSDSRSVRSGGSTGSLQFVLGEIGYADLDRYNPYQDVLNFFGHLFWEVAPYEFGRRGAR